MKLNKISRQRNTSKKNRDIISQVKSKPRPRHVSVIMDGNGRWAERRGLPRIAGHRQGVEVMREIIEISVDLSLEYLTLYAFSTENWKRPKNEIKAIMSLLVEYLRRELNALHRNNIKIITFGDTSQLPKAAYEEIQKAVETTSANTGLQVNVALNYGGRLEIVNAIKKIAQRIKNNELCIDDIDERLISDHLYTAGIPDPDLLIRTGGDRRVSNFLLYQIAYTELWFSDPAVYWPDFSIKYYLDAICDFQNRNRRYGGVNTKGED